MRSDIVVRPASRDDIGAIRQCVKRAYTMYVPRMGKKPAPMLADYTKLVDNNAVHVAVVEPMIAGLIVMFGQDDHWFVENIAVDPMFQGRGLGTRLMAFAETEARGHAHTRVELYTHQKMTENLGFYPKLGYERFDERVEEGYRRVYFRKFLAAR